MTTLALGEEDGITTKAIGEEEGSALPGATTLAVGEEDGGSVYTPPSTNCEDMHDVAREVQTLAKELLDMIKSWK